MATAPRLMLLMNGVASGSGIGNLIAGALAAHYPPGSMARFSTCNGVPPGDREWCGHPLRYAGFCELPFPMLSTAMDALLRLRLPRLVAGTAEYGRANGAEGILAVLNSPTIIHAALPLAERLGLPLYAMVWDPPEYFAMNMGLGKAATRRMLCVFEATLHAARGLAVMGEGMAEWYGRSFQGRAVIVRHGIHPDLWRQPPKRRGTDELVIGFAGSLYAKAEWRALLAALESVQYEICGRPVVVKLLGRVPLRGVPMPASVQSTGTLSMEETIAVLGEADVAYLPYWFDAAHAKVVRLSFPSKLSAYAAARVPVLYHGPADSSLTPFFQRYRMGAACHSLEPEAILDALRRLAGDAELRREAEASCGRALADELGLEAMLGRSAEFLGISRDALLPVRGYRPVTAGEAI